MKKKEKIMCLRCLIEKNSNSQNFYVNNNDLFASEKLEICKDCISKYIGRKESLGYLDRVKMILSIMDRPFIFEQWVLREEDWSKYIPQICSFHQYKDKKYRDSVFENKNTMSFDIIDERISNVTEEDVRELSVFWGTGLTIDEYLYLQKEYQELLDAYESDSYTTRLLFQEVSHQRLSIKKLRQDGKPVDKELKTLQELLGSANIKPNQETGANSTDQESFGTLIKKYEHDRPVPEPDEEWKDVDGIKRYYQVWFLGHLCRMLNIENDYSAMYDEEVGKYSVEIPEYQNDEDDDI